MANPNKVTGSENKTGNESKPTGAEAYKQYGSQSMQDTDRSQGTNFGQETGTKSQGQGASFGQERGTAGESRDNVKSFLGGKAKGLLEGAGVENWDDVKDKASEALDRAKGYATDVSGRVKDGASHALESVDSTVRQYPMQAVLVGFGVGCLLGALIGGSRRHA